MMELDHTLLRKLAEWDPAGMPVTSIHLTVDGRRYPRKPDYAVRLDELLRRARSQAEPLGRAALRSVEGDLAAISDYVRDDFERGDTRGLALFSSHDAALWEDVRVPRPLLDRAVVAPQAELLPLEQLLETYHRICVVLVDFEKARLFVSQLGRIEEVFDVWDEVPGRHDQGGWAQKRMQRHVDDHREKHVKRVAEALFRLWKEQAFDHLILAGPAEAHAELERDLHDYLVQRIRARITLPVLASAEEVLRRTLEIEEELERGREHERVEQLTNVSATGRRGVTGLSGTLSALAEGRVAELLVSIDLSVPGARCSACGRLVEHGSTCTACGSALERVPDVVEAAVTQAFRQGCRVETVVANGLAALGGIGGILRF